jgi:hypothetical protein
MLDAFQTGPTDDLLLNVLCIYLYAQALKS